MSVFEDPGLFGRLWAADYDGPGNPDPAPAVDFLADLADGGPVLELAIGTGRVALPLAARGLSVHGVEASEEMLAQLRAKPGGDQIPVVVADMADVPVKGDFRLATSGVIDSGSESRGVIATTTPRFQGTRVDLPPPGSERLP